MSDLKHQDDDSVVLNVTDYAVVAHAVTPQVFLFASQWLSPLPGIVR
jgi:hypothetical protein